MTKKHFIALADAIRANNCRQIQAKHQFGQTQLEVLADFCAGQNVRFNRSRWLGYIAGTNGKNGGKVK